MENFGRYARFKRHIKNVYEHSLALNHVNVIHDYEDWHPIEDENFKPTDCAPGSPLKLLVMIERLEKGYPLWHDEDRNDFHKYFNVTGEGSMPFETEHRCWSRQRLKDFIKRSKNSVAKENCEENVTHTNPRNV